MKKAERNPRGRWLLWFKRKLAKVYPGLRGGLMCISNHKRQFLIYQDTEEGERLLYLRVSKYRPFYSYRNIKVLSIQVDYSWTNYNFDYLKEKNPTLAGEILKGDGSKVPLTYLYTDKGVCVMSKAAKRNHIGLWLIRELKLLRKQHPYVTIEHTAKNKLTISYRSIGGDLSKYAKELIRRINEKEIVDELPHPEKELL